MSTFFLEQGNSNDEEILERLASLKSDDLSSDGHAFAFIYDAGDSVNNLARKAFASGMTGNGLDPTVYPSARRLENDLVGACLEHLRAPDDACGTITSGGTESVILSVKAARDYARQYRPEVSDPNILVPETAHASFHKAAHYLGVRLILVDIDPTTMRASVEDTKSKLDDNTILIVASAPSYAHGVIDPIVELGQLAQDKGVLLHVDACIGGWVLPFQRDNGVAIPDFDFQVPGVTSMSVDLHKYGFTPKGISVLLSRSRKLRDCQYYSCARWSGYSIVNPSILGSKSIAPMAAAWAIFQHLGKSGYRELVGSMWTATEKFVEGVSQIEGIKVLGKPTMGLIAVACGKSDVFELADRLTEAGWHVQPTYAFGNSPAHIHFSIDPGNSSRVDAFLVDLAAASKNLPEYSDAPEALVQLLEAVAQGGGGLDTSTMMAEFGIRDGKLPDKQATIHRLLNSCSPQAREKLLILFLGEMFS
ncbi:MAG: aspartate aminotransferase family protein [Kofleriaceae bacterium]|nr:aspartate aminotransferase family protein [Kofleriaceae bacterium]